MMKSLRQRKLFGSVKAKRKKYLKVPCILLNKDNCECQV